MQFFWSLVVEGALAGALYALIALAFVIVYKASHVINFALGEWMMVASLLVATGLNALGLGLAGAFAFAFGGMSLLAWAFNVLALQRLVGQPLISLLMVTLGLGALLRGASQLTFAGIPSGIALPVPSSPFSIGGIWMSAEKVVAAIVAMITIALVAWVQKYSRTGVALRAIADDQKAAMVVGIDVHRHFLMVWCMAGAICVLAGTLWTSITGGGFGASLVGLKIFPIVIIGGLDSIPGTIIAAIAIGVVESVATGYLEPYFGSGCGLLVTYSALIGMLVCRPHGLFGVAKVERV